jgi:hypothetical protein
MKKIVAFSALILLFACNTAPKQEPVDLAAEEIAIKEVFETMFKAIEDKDIELIASLFADEGIFLGTAPVEIFPKDDLVSTWAQMLQVQDLPPIELIDEPIIRIHPDGKTAVIVYHFTQNLFTTLPLRQSNWMVKGDSGWLIDFMDFSIVPYNEQIPTLNAAVMPEEE